MKKELKHCYIVRATSVKHTFYSIAYEISSFFEFQFSSFSFPIFILFRSQIVILIKRSGKKRIKLKVLFFPKQKKRIKFFLLNISEKLIRNIQFYLSLYSIHIFIDISNFNFSLISIKMNLLDKFRRIYQTNINHVN